MEFNIGGLQLKFSEADRQRFQLGDLNSKNVKVEARSPTGRIQELTVSETQGTYTTNFTPSEVGDWSISIMYNRKHIEGSPFNVRVYDAAQVKVFGLEGGAVGKAFSFSADVSGAGQGELDVEITHNGRSVSCSLHEDTGRRDLYRVTFIPDGPGIYTIRVYFAGNEITGSPYTLEIVDSSMVTASGDGLLTTEVNRRSSFLINTHGATGGDIKVSITSPRGQPVNSNIFNQGDGTYRVEYMVTEAGEYLVDVAYSGRSINGSPFKVSAVDANRIIVSNLQSSGQVGRLVEFDIDAAHAGSGNLEIMVNDGTIPCSVQNRGNRQFHASFNPKEATAHKIQMKFNGKEVPGSPWRVDIRSPVQVSASGQGLQMINVRQAANVDIKTNDPYNSGVLSSTIISPTGRSVPNQIFNNYNGSYRMEYSVQEVGNHNIDILYDGAPIPGSPFVAKAYDPSAIVIGNVPSGVVGKPVEFTIDVTQAGEGQLEIMVNRGSVPNTVKMLRKGVFLVSFVPREPRQHIIEIKFNGELLPRCPINVPILDASRVTVQGDGIRQVAVNKHSSFRVNTAAAGEAELDVRVTAPNNQMVPAKMVLQPDGDYKVEYSSRYTGRHMVEILWAGQPIMGSPFYVEIYDPNKIRVDGVKVGTVGERMTFDIIRHEAGKAELGLTIVSPSGKDVPYEITPTPLGERVTYIAHESGPHHIYITYGGLEVPGCPMTQNVQESGSIRAFGDGLFKGEEDKPATFYVDTQGKRGDLFVQVDGPNSIAKCNIEPERSGRYVVTYVPLEVGLFNIQIKWNNREVEGSPFRAKILDPKKIHVIGGWQTFLDAGDHMVLNVGETKIVKFDCSNAGPGTLSAEVKCPNGQAMPVDVYSEGKGIYVVSFVVRQHGDHYLSVKYGEMPLPRSPYYGTTQGGGRTGTINIEKVVLTGRGLQEASVGQEAEFVIDGTDAGPGTPEVSLKGIKTDIPVQIMELGQNKYRCIYNPQMPGGYLLTISWSGRQVRGSPFKVNVTAVGDATKVQCTGEGLKMGIMGREIKSVIDTRRAGPGELTAQCRGPTKVAYCELFDHQDGTFTLNIKPQEVGKHTLQIKYDGENVPGSPYTLRVSGAPDASKVKCYGPGIEDGVLHNFASHFIVETRGAGAGQLTVRVRGPKGAFRVEMRRESQKDRTIKCQYDPIEVGDYIIHVKWSGEHVPGSPFRSQIFDTHEELERARQQKHWSN